MTRSSAAPASIEQFSHRAVDKLRYGDTDRLGHINNANFATFYETGRIELLNAALGPVAQAGSDFVIVHLSIDFMFEILWPGEVSIGTEIIGVRRTSCKFRQAIFQHDRCVSVAESVVVLMDDTTRRATPIPDEARSFLEEHRRGDA